MFRSASGWRDLYEEFSQTLPALTFPLPSFQPAFTFLPYKQTIARTAINQLSFLKTTSGFGAASGFSPGVWGGMKSCARLAQSRCCDIHKFRR